LSFSWGPEANIFSGVLACSARAGSTYSGEIKKQKGYLTAAFLLKDKGTSFSYSKQNLTPTRLHKTNIFGKEEVLSLALSLLSQGIHRRKETIMIRL